MTDSRKALVGVGLVVAASLVNLLRVLHGATAAPNEEDWRNAERVVRAGFRPGDLVVAAPGWADPQMRRYLGDLVPVAVAARIDSDRFARIWEVSLRGHAAPEAAPPAACEAVHQGKVRVRRCSRVAARVRSDLLAELASAEVALVRDGREQPCRLENDHFTCAGLTVAILVGEVDFEPHRCIALSPSLGPDPVRIRWPSIPLGSRLVGYTGIHTFYARKAARGTVDVDIAIDGRFAAHLEHHNDDGWRRFEIPTGGAEGKTGSLRLELRAAEPQDRRFCFAAEVRS